MSFEHGIEYTATAADNGVMNSGFPARGSMFITPPGCKPMGPVSVFCTNRQECVVVDPVTGQCSSIVNEAYLAARAW